MNVMHDRRKYNGFYSLMTLLDEIGVHYSAETVDSGDPNIRRWVLTIDEVRNE